MGSGSPFGRGRVRSRLAPARSLQRARRLRPDLCIAVWCWRNPAAQRCTRHHAARRRRPRRDHDRAQPRRGGTAVLDRIEPADVLTSGPSAGPRKEGLRGEWIRAAGSSGPTHTAGPNRSARSAGTPRARSARSTSTGSARTAAGLARHSTGYGTSGRAASRRLLLRREHERPLVVMTAAVVKTNGFVLALADNAHDTA